MQMQPFMDEHAHSPVDSLVFLTNRVGRLLAQEIRHQASVEEWGVSAQHMGILVDLWVEEGVRQQDLAISNIKDKGTIARALQSLEASGIVARVPDEKDKRNKLIYLTKRGKALRSHLLPQARRTESEAARGISEEELATCQRVLKHIYHQFIKA